MRELGFLHTKLDTVTSGTAQSHRGETVRFENTDYSVPVELIGKTVEGRIYPGRIRIYHEGEKVADHPRNCRRKDKVREPEHYKPVFEKKPRAEVMFV